MWGKGGGRVWPILIRVFFSNSSSEDQNPDWWGSPALIIIKWRLSKVVCRFFSKSCFVLATSMNGSVEMWRLLFPQNMANFAKQISKILCRIRNPLQINNPPTQAIRISVFYLGEISPLFGSLSFALLLHKVQAAARESWNIQEFFNGLFFNAELLYMCQNITPMLPSILLSKGICSSNVQLLTEHQCFFYGRNFPIFELKNMISIYAKEFAWKKWPKSTRFWKFFSPNHQIFMISCRR